MNYHNFDAILNRVNNTELSSLIELLINGNESPFNVLFLILNNVKRTLEDYFRSDDKLESSRIVADYCDLFSKIVCSFQLSVQDASQIQDELRDINESLNNDSEQFSKLLLARLQMSNFFLSRITNRFM